MQLRKNSRNKMRRNTSIRRVGSVISLFIGLILLGCEEGPLGYEELERGELEVYQDTLRADSMAFYSLEIPLGESPTLFGGRDSLAEARMLFAIDGLDSIVAFDSVKLLLRPYEEAGISNQNVLFRAYPVTTEWEEEGCTWKLTDGYIRWSKEGSDFDSTDLVFEFTAGSDQIEILLDPERHDVYYQGLVFVPQNEGFAYIGAFEADTSKEPRIIGFKGDDTVTFQSAANSKYYAAVVDATIIEPFVVNTEDYLIGAGLAWHTFMHFSLGALPDTVDITSADFRLAYERFFFPEDYLDLSCYRLVAPYDGSYSDLSNAMAGRDSLGLVDDTSSISLVEIVQFWADIPDSNFGLVACHSFLPNPPSFGQQKRIYALGKVVGKPELVITYTKPPSSRFK
ncbi:hypothetical protein JXM67_06695 [candidate division WOR-3 bacterium]|nr:hypothetical protein [candidate division WOR-3 bacterium]